VHSHYTNNSTRPGGISESNRSRLASLHRALSGTFTVEDAVKVLGMDANRVRRFLAYLASRGWLSRVRRGLYVTVPLEASAPSEWREDPWVAAARAFQPCYIGGWSACEHWGLTEQIFHNVIVITARSVRDRRPTFQDTQFRIKVLPEAMLFGTRSVWRGDVRLNVSDPSRTLVDVLDDPALGGGIRHVADVITTYFAGDLREDALLLDYAGRLGNRTVYKRLGYLAEALSLELPGILAACRDNMSSGYTVLDPTAKTRGRLVRRWNLWANVRIHPVEHT
jgi:predicted transcriptional regulator of viral defense system